MPAAFPVDDVIPALVAALRADGQAILEAPPGAGKSTRVPLALLADGWAAGDRPGKVLMLEPRRVAARSVATFMAQQLGEPVGTTVGYRTRTDTRVSKHTRLEVVTEGVLTRLLLADPELSDVSLVIFDEFHERSLNGDLGLALVHEVREALRDDLALLVMSATLDSDALQRFLAAPVVRSEGKSYPVATRYRPPQDKFRWQDHCAAVVSEVLTTADAKTVLVFLPGQAEIRRVASALANSTAAASVTVAPLHGGLPLDQQQAVITQARDGDALVVLTTNVAETSLTIENVTHVIDSGLAREPVYDPARHRSRLVTRRISSASARQRAGRAGRLGPGTCIRLWPENEVMAAHQKPEIQRVALDQLVLDLARWGCTDPIAMAWLDAPPQPAWQSAVERLRASGAIDTRGALTETGKGIARVGIEPALAQLVLEGKRHGLAVTAARIAALLQARDISPGQGSDLRTRLEVLERRGRDFFSVLDEARRLQQAKQDDHDWHDALGALLCAVFPLQIARARPDRVGAYQMADGPGVRLPEGDALAGLPWLLILDTDGQPKDARIRLALPLDGAVVLRAVEAHGETVERTGWDRERKRVTGRSEQCLGAIVLSSEMLSDLDPAQVATGLLAGVREMGLECLPWTDSTRQWRARVQKLAAAVGEGGGDCWPDVLDAGLLATLDHWLAPYLNGMRTLEDLKAVPLAHALNGLLTPNQQHQLAREMPTHVTIPTGRDVALDYTGETVVLAVKLQELFGLRALPELAGGQLRISAHLLTPAGRPAAITDNLERFWTENYAAVRKDLRGRYPKHPWPEDPLQAVATAKTKSRL